MLSCSAPERQGEDPREQRLRKTDAEPAELSWGTRFSRHWLRSPGVTRNIFFFLVRETRPPWQSADSLETHKDRRAEGSTKRRGKGERAEKSHRGPSPDARAPQGSPRTSRQWGHTRPATEILLAQPMGPMGGDGALGPEDVEPCSTLWAGSGTLSPPKPLWETQLPPAKDLKPGGGK